MSHPAEGPETMDAAPCAHRSKHLSWRIGVCGVCGNALTYAQTVAGTCERCQTDVPVRSECAFCGAPMDDVTDGTLAL